MPPYTGTQRHYISQFVGFTQAKDAVAAKVSVSHFERVGARTKLDGLQ
jgi:hypothetical protein